MKKKLPLANTPLPRFRSDNKAAGYFRTHSVAKVWDQLLEAQPVKASKALDKSIRERHAAAKSPISIRLGPGNGRIPVAGLQRRFTETVTSR